MNRPRLATHFCHLVHLHFQRAHLRLGLTGVKDSPSVFASVDDEPDSRPGSENSVRPENVVHRKRDGRLLDLPRFG